MKLLTLVYVGIASWPSLQTVLEIPICVNRCCCSRGLKYSNHTQNELNRGRPGCPLYPFSSRSPLLVHSWLGASFVNVFAQSSCFVYLTASCEATGEIFPFALVHTQPEVNNLSIVDSSMSVIGKQIGEILSVEQNFVKIDLKPIKKFYSP